MPSFFDQNLDELDLMPAIPGFSFASNSDSDAYREFRSRTENITRNIQQHPVIKLIGDDSLKRIVQPSISYY